MLRDLEELRDRPRDVDADVLVIGAGIGGLLAAVRLSRAGMRVVVLESGGRSQGSETHPLNRVVQTGQHYAGAEHGRFRCLGGTSTRWGGAMIPFLPEDMDSHTAGWVPSWCPDYRALLSHLPEIEACFGLPAGAYEQPAFQGLDKADGGAFVARFAKWPAFRLRNLAVVFETAIHSPEGPEIWLNATTSGFAFAPDGRLASVVARSAKGGEITVSARQVILAAGAIESTRLLLLADRACDERLFAPDDVLGRYLGDHLSAPIADLLPRDRALLNGVVGFRFEGRAMRNLRFEMLGATRRQFGLPASFTHIALEDGGEGGFEALRDLFRALQKRRFPDLATLGRLLAHSPWLARAVWWRFAKQRLLFPAEGGIAAHLVTEQMPRRDNRITLSDSERDAFGLPLASLHWRVGPEDEALFGRIAERFQDMWRESALADLADLEPRAEADWREALSEGGGIYHPCGTIRIGSAPSNGVVDANLRAFRLPNLHVVSTAVFPVVGGANPTLTMMLHACRLTDALAARSREG